MVYNLGTIGFALVGSAVLYALLKALYNLLLHPLAKFEGPLLWKTFRIPFVVAMVSGRLPQRICDIHKRYGPVVRVGPDELSFTDPRSWKDIHQTPGLNRPQLWRGKPPGTTADNLITASEEVHARFRKVLRPAFSDNAVQKQEPLIQGYIDALMKRLTDMAREKPKDRPAVVNIVEWFNFTTFDIIGDLGWGASFDCLESGKLNPWIQVVMHFKAVIIMGALKFYPLLNSILEAITPESALADIYKVLDTADKKVTERLSSKTDRPDIMSHIQAQNEASSSLYMSKEEIQLNSMALIIAGSESLTTILSSILNNLLAQPECYETLIREVRSSFKVESDINGISTKSLVYLNAVLQEGMRISPSIPDGSRREVPVPGVEIAGHFIPPRTVVSIPQWSTYQSEENFHKPANFLPERWLPEAQSSQSPFKDDRRAAFQPFAYGAHNCLGQPLAWLEMRVILARLLWNFDLRLPKGRSPLIWEKQKIYWVWEKEPIMVEITSRHL